MREREREREREHARAIAISSPRRSRSRRQTFQSPLITISPSRDHAVDRDLAARSRSRSHRIEIAISPLRDRTGSRSRSRLCEITPDRDRRRSRSCEDCDLAFARLRRRSRSREEGAIWVVACVFLDLCFLSSFPNTRKYFPEFFLKCNQTPWKHFPFPEISISGKYIFFGKCFTATKHSLDLSVCS